MSETVTRPMIRLDQLPDLDEAPRCECDYPYSGPRCPNEAVWVCVVKCCQLPIVITCARCKADAMVGFAIGLYACGTCEARVSPESVEWRSL